MEWLTDIVYWPGYNLPVGDQLKDAGQLVWGESGVLQLHHLQPRYRRHQDLPVHRGGIQSKERQMVEFQVFCQGNGDENILNLICCQNCANQVYTLESHQSPG